MEGNRGKVLVDIIKKLTPLSLGAEKLISDGATEADFVKYGLEDSMMEGLSQFLGIAKTENVDFRTAAMMNSIQKVAAVWNINSNVFFWSLVDVYVNIRVKSVVNVFGFWNISIW